MPPIPSNSALGYLGVIFSIAGLFLIAGALGIIRLQQINITLGKRTLSFGIFLIVVGMIFLLSEINRPITPVNTPTPPMTSNTSLPTDTPTPSPALTETSSPKLTPLLTPLPSPTATPITPTPTSVPRCPYQADTDAQTIAQLIQAESKAVNEKDISIIKDIFASGAIIRDVVSGEEWNNPVTRYETLFVNATYTNATHSSIRPAGQGITESTAWFTSGSSGSFVTPSNATPVSYNNPPKSDHWTFGKNRLGCWVIVNFTFNASHIPFP